MKNLKYIIVGFVLLFAVSVVSAGWFGGITGNVAVSTSFPDADKCEDSDEGFFQEDFGAVRKGYLWGMGTLKKDICKGNRFRVILPDGTKTWGYPRLREYYCNTDGNRDYETYDSEAYGPGYCIRETVTINHIVLKKVGKWVPDTPVCSVVKDGVVRNERNKEFKSRCIGKKYIAYSCSADGTTVVNDTITCSNKCKVSAGGCIGTCAGETDTANDKDVPGSLTLDGVAKPDVCSGTNAVSQYQCVDNAIKSVKKESCGTNRGCDDGDGSGAFCKDLYADVVVGGEVEDVVEDVTSLESRLDAVEAILCATDNTHSFCTVTCTTSLTCVDNYANQCGTGLSDGCADTLDCSGACLSPNVCNQTTYTCVAP